MLPLLIPINQKSAVPLYQQLYEALKEEIITRRLEPHVKLPSIRQLATSLNMSKTTVEATYHQLVIEGYVKSEAKVGYYVNPIAQNEFFKETKTKESGPAAGRNEENRSVVYDFSNEYIDRDSFDFSLWRKYVNKALRDNERLISYGSHQGEEELRVEIARYIHRSRGVLCSPEQIVVGAGVQSILNILCALLKKEHDSVGFEEPGFKKGQQVFSDHGFAVIPIKLEEDGLDVKHLEKTGSRIVYVSPSHQYPMGTTLPINKRIQLLNWAHAKKGLVIEDDYDSELRYFGRPVASLQGLNKGESVIYLGTFSKILLPSLRISFMVLPGNILEKHREQLASYNQTSSKIEQMALALFMRDGQLEKHIRRLRKLYAKKSQALIASLNKIMGDKVTVSGGEKGLHLLLEVKSDLNTVELVAAAAKKGIKLTPVARFTKNQSREEKKHPLILLSYGGIQAEQMQPALRLLQEAWFA